MREELLAYYETLPVNVDDVIERLEAMYADRGETAPCLLKAHVHTIMAEQCAVHVFSRFPFYFEIESGRGRYEWGFGRLGQFLECKTASKWIEPYRASIQADVEEGMFFGWNPIGMDHHCPGYDNIFRFGLSGQDDIARGRLAAETDPDKRAFYQAVLESNAALRLTMNKFADQAERLLETAPDEVSRANLERIARTAREVPDRPPRTFYEALETILFIREAYGTFEGMGMSTFGHLDRLLGPFYEADRAVGRITYDEAKALINALLDYTECRYKPKIERVETSTTIILGGCSGDGALVFNDVTRMVLECVIENRYVGTKINTRVSRSHPQEYLDLLAEVLLAGVPVLAIQNDDTHIAGRVRQGFDVRDARLYVSGGCHETVMANTEVNTRADSWISLPALLMRLLRQGGEYATFDDLYRAFMDFTFNYYQSIEARKNRYEALWASLSPAPMYSASLTGCLESGRDLTAGGAKYNTTTLSFVGAATVIDSLFAIRELVYNRHQMTLSRLTEIVVSDFAGEGRLRAQILQLPHHGTNHAEMNEFSRRYLHELSRVAGQTNARGGKYLPGFYPHELFILLGERLCATPDGRHAGYYLSRGISPSEFVDVKSPLDIINSIRCIDFADYTESFATELTLPMMKGERGRNVLTAIIRAFMDAKGSTLQINLLDREELLAAKADPDQHRHLIVRVCGYSERFISLSERQQDEVISRAIRRG